MKFEKQGKLLRDKSTLGEKASMQTRACLSSASRDHARGTMSEICRGSKPMSPTMVPVPRETFMGASDEKDKGSVDEMR